MGNEASEPGTFAGVRTKAEFIVQALGDQNTLVSWMNGETLLEYRQRLLQEFQQYSPWKGADISGLSGNALDTVEAQIYADAMQAATDSARVPAGTLRESIQRDSTGRPIRSFYGDPEACWGPFKRAPRLVTGWNLSPNFKPVAS